MENIFLRLTTKGATASYHEVMFHFDDRDVKQYVHRRRADRKILHAVQRGRVSWMGHTYRRNCLLRIFIDGKIEGTGVRRRRKNIY